jgi:hypothetical protein
VAAGDAASREQVLGDATTEHVIAVRDLVTWGTVGASALARRSRSVVSPRSTSPTSSPSPDARSQLR